MCRLDSLLAATLALSAPLAHADAVTDWNGRTIDFVVAAGLANQPAHRALAIAHTAAYDAAQSVSTISGPGAATINEAAITAAHCSALTRLLAAQKAAIEASCNTAWRHLPAGDAKDIAIEAGKRAATEVLTRRAEDGSTAADNYRPYTTAGRYVPTAVPASPHWGWSSAMADGQPFGVSTGTAATSGQRTLGTRLQRDQEDGQCPQQRAQCRADRNRSVLADHAPVHLPCIGALGRRQAGARSAAQCASVRSLHAGDRRRDDCSVRRQVPLRLLAPDHGDSQRRDRRQRCDRAGPVLDTADQHADASRVSVCTLRSSRGDRGGAGRRDRLWPGTA